MHCTLYQASSIYCQTDRRVSRIAINILPTEDKATLGVEHDICPEILIGRRTYPGSLPSQRAEVIPGEMALMEYVGKNCLSKTQRTDSQGEEENGYGLFVLRENQD